MPIQTNLNIDPYFDDFDISKKYYRTLFKPGFALQARELTSLQSTLQNQIEQFGENIFKEGSIIRGCSFNQLDDLQYVKVRDGIDPVDYIERTVTVGDTTREYYYELIDEDNGLRAIIITAAKGFESRAPDLNTFFIRYLNSANTGVAQFTENATLTIEQYYIETDENGDETVVGPETPTDEDDEELPETCIVDPNGTEEAPSVGLSYGLEVTEGVIFQRGHFLFADAQKIIVVKYNIDEEGEPLKPNDINVGYIVDESIVTSQVDTSLLDNATGSPNEQAPGADRLMLVPRLVAITSDEAEEDEEFFTLIRYQNGQAVQIRDVSEYNVIGDQMARRTHEAAGDFMPQSFKLEVARVGSSEDTFENDIKAIVGPGVVYAKGFRVENRGDQSFTVDPIADDETDTITDEPVSFEDRGWYAITGANGVIDNYRSFQTVNLLANNDSIIGSAVIKDINATKVFFVPASVRMTANTFRDVRYIKDGVGATGKFAIDVRSYKGGQNGMIFPTGMFSVKNAYNYRFPIRNMQTTQSITANTLTLGPKAGSDEVFDHNSLSNILIVTSANAPIAVNSVSIIGPNLVIVANTTTVADCRVYYTATRGASGPALQPVTKTIREPFVKFWFQDTITHYTLGIPDCFELLEVVDEATGVDYTNSFKLISGQRPNFYDWASVQLKRGSKMPPDTTLLTVQVRCFEAAFSTSANAVNFFSINSYPATANDDFNVSQLRDVTNIFGKTHNLRDSIDFRPYRIALANVQVTTSNTATEIANTATVALPSTGQLFANTLTYAVPAPGTTGFIDYDYYLNRTDIITVDKYGNFSLEKGEAGKNSRPPEVDGKTIIAEVRVPGVPALTQEETVKEGDEAYAVTIRPTGVARAYTMSDIDKISKQVDRLTYYTTLTMLEKATSELSIKDADGLNRFKNGIIVDTFEDLNNANVNDEEFNAAVDYGEQAMGPAVDMLQLNLVGYSSSNVTMYDSNTAASLASHATQVRFIAQPYATSTRPVSTSAFRYWGRVALSPNFSTTYDHLTRPALTRDLREKYYSASTPKLQKFAPITSVARNDVRTSKAVDKINGNAITAHVTVVDEVYDVQGKKVTDINKIMGYTISTTMNPFMKPNYINIRVFGLRPNTRHWFFFDRRAVSQFVRPAKMVNGKFTVYGKYGASVKTGADGVLRAQFRIPGATFLCGQRRLYIFDQDNWDSANRTAVSRAWRDYSAYSYTVYRAGSTPALRQIEHDWNQVETNASVTSRAVAPQEERQSAPLAQTFFVKKAMTGLAECLHVSKANLYFQRKSATNGITVSLREVVNGYPASSTIPFSEVHLERSQVNVSATGTVATTVTFPIPIRLDAEKEYALVILADADDPDYLVWTSVIGRRRAGTHIQVAQDWGDGNLFSSTNGTAWHAYTGEDLKFELYRHNYVVSTGTVTLQTDDYEFMTFSDQISTFEANELVYGFSTANTYTVTANSSTDTISATDLGAAFTAGDYIYLSKASYDANTEPFDCLIKVDSVVNGTTLNLAEAPPWSGTANIIGRQVVAGRVNSHDPEEPLGIILEKSSARSGRVFTVGQEIVGIESGATAEIDSLDDYEFSYGQLLFNKVTDSTTSIRAFIYGPNPANTAAPVANNTYEMSYVDNTYFSKNGLLIRSRSADVTSALNAKVRFNFARVVSAAKFNTQTSTPLLDIESATLNLYRYRVTEEADTTSNYVTKTVHLADGFEANDFRLWTTAYRPVGTDINVYIRLKNADDATDIKLNPWIQLEMEEGVGQFSSITNRDNFYEYVYNIPSANKGNDPDGDVRYDNDTGDYTGFNQFELKIELTSDVIHRAPRLVDYRGVAFE